MMSMPASHTRHRPSHLVGFLLLGYGLLIVNGSLYPFAGWRWPAEAPWAYLGAPWPRYLLSWEIPLNIAGYIPLGLLLAARILTRASPSTAMVGAGAGGLLLSLLLETLQVFIPGRIASNLDVASNGLGALLGGVIAVAMDGSWDARTRFRQLRSSFFVEGYFADMATTLLLAWIFAQINPGLSLLGTSAFDKSGDADPLIDYSASGYFIVEGLLVGMNALFMLVLLRLLTRSTQASLVGLALLALISAVLKTLGGAALLRLPAPWLWLTPGALAGVIVATVVFTAWSRQWQGSLKWLGVAAFAGVQVFSYALPRNPYLDMMLQPISTGHLSNLVGATWWTAQWWPWLALICLIGLPSATYSSRRLYARH